MLINKDTKMYGSFSMEPGNNGNIYFNKQFKKNNINAIYKSYYSNNIKNSFEAAKCLGFSGFAVSAPFKEEVLEFVDGVESPVDVIGAANTIVNVNGRFIAHNTDWIGVMNYFLNYYTFYHSVGWKINGNKVTILGDGGFSKAAQYAFTKMDLDYELITRKEWYKIPELKGIIFNCTPIDIEIPKTSLLIDGRPFTKEGQRIAKLQAEEQYKLYMKYA